MCNAVNILNLILIKCKVFIKIFKFKNNLFYYFLNSLSINVSVLYEESDTSINGFESAIYQTKIN